MDDKILQDNMKHFLVIEMCQIFHTFYHTRIDFSLSSNFKGAPIHDNLKSIVS